MYLFLKNYRRDLINEIISTAESFISGGDTPSDKRRVIDNDEYREIRVGILNGAPVHLVFLQEQAPEATIESLWIEVEGMTRPTRMPPNAEALSLLSTDSLRELRDAFRYSTYPARVNGSRRHQELYGTTAMAPQLISTN